MYFDNMLLEMTLKYKKNCIVCQINNKRKIKPNALKPDILKFIEKNEQEKIHFLSSHLNQVLQRKKVPSSQDEYGTHL